MRDSELEFELEAELEDLMATLNRNSLEAEAEVFSSSPLKQPAAASDTSAVLAFKIPEAPYSPNTFKWLEKTLDVFDAVHTTFDVFGPELWGLVPGILEASGPLAVFFGFWLEMGGSYLEAQANIARDAMRSGFRLGVVTGADPSKWLFVKDLFWQKDPNYLADARAGAGAGKLEQQSHNAGLATGFVQGQQIAKNPLKKKFFWDSIISTLRDIDVAEFRGDRSRWPRTVWQSWYILLATRFDRLYLKD